MKKIHVVSNSFIRLKSVKIVITGLLLIGLGGCEEETPKTTAMDLNLPSLGGKPLTGIVFKDEQNSLDSVVMDTITENINITDKTVEKSIVSDQPYLTPTDIALKAKQRVAPQLLDSLFKGDQFYPLGWSPNGEKFAYGIVREGSAKREVYIQDLVTDKVVWHITTGTEFNNYATENNSIESDQKILVGLKRYEIKQNDHIAIKNAPISYRGDVFNYTVKSSTANNGHLMAYKVLLNSQTKGGKEISNVTLKELSEQYGNKEKVAVLGYFQGGNKARVATLLGLLETAPKGVRVMRYKIVGASLKYGKWHLPI
jgi:hypothetical protein